LSSSEKGLPNLLANCKNEFSIRRSINYYIYTNIKREKSNIHVSLSLISAFIFFYVKAEEAESIFGPSNGNKTSFCKNTDSAIFPQVLELLFREFRQG
jgi:hypothetical protein